MEISTENQSQSPSQTIVPNLLGPSPSSPAIDPVEAQRIIAEKTAETRIARARNPDGPGAPLPFRVPLTERIARIAAAAHDGTYMPTQQDVEREAASLVAGKLEVCGVPERYRGASLAADFSVCSFPPDDDGKYDRAARHLTRLLHSPGIVALLGAYGTGKTWLACGLVLDFCRAGRPARFADAMDYFQALKESYDDDRKLTEAQVERKWLKPELLVLDEMEIRHESKWEDDKLTRLINKRYSAELATVLIGNLSPEDFNERVGPRIADRIHDDKGGVILCDWQSLRGGRSG